jgi:hypothetical protein
MVKSGEREVKRERVLECSLEKVIKRKVGL